MAGEGKDTKGMEDEYKTFLAELGGKDAREMAAPGQPVLPLPTCVLDWVFPLAMTHLSATHIHTRLAQLP